MGSLQNSKILLKREKEKQVVKLMIDIYCKGNKHGDLSCTTCSDLIDYVDMRIDRCPFMETKTFCSTCPVHCYKKDMKEKIKEVMRYSGPRMIFHHPILTLDHVYQDVKHSIKTKLFAKGRAVE